MINGQGTQVIPNQQVVIPQITIPQGYQQFINPVSAPPIKQITVNGKDAAAKYKLPPNSRVALFDENEQLFYYKETDESGNDVTFKTCSYVEVEEPPEPEYLTVQEFRSSLDEFGKRLKEELVNGQFIRAQAGKHQADE